MKNKRNFKYGLNSAVIIIGTIIAVILLNSILISFDDKISLEVDLTKDEIYRLSDDTKNVIEKIDKETKIVLLYDSRYEEEETYKEKIEEEMALISSVVDKYIEENDNITYEELDYYKNPAVFMEENSVYTDIILDINAKGVSPMLSMAFVQEDRYEVADYSTYYEQVFNEESEEIENESNLENVITNKLSSLISGGAERFSKILYTTGHGEINVSNDMKTLLAQHSYATENINLLGKNIPVNEKVLLIINSPTSDFSDGEIQKVDDFLKAGGNVQVYFNPSRSNVELPKLESYLSNSWGIVRKHDIISDMPNKIESSSDGYVVAAGEFAEHDIVKDFSDLRVKYTSANPLEIKDDKQMSIVVDEVLITSDEAVLKTVETASEPVAPGDVKGKYNVILTSTQDHYDIYNKKTTGKVLVCGSSYTLDYFVHHADCSNKTMLINSFNWMSGNTTEINIESKELPEGGLVITNASKWGWFSVLVVVLPVAVLAAGFFVFIKRRYK